MKKVLVIEDDVPLCWLLEKILQKKYEVILVIMVWRPGLGFQMEMFQI